MKNQFLVDTKEDFEAENIELNAIKSGLKQLNIRLKAYGKNPHEFKDRAELEWEVRLYEFILASDSPAKQARKYFQTRNPLGSTMRSKRHTVRLLGWKIK